MNLNDNPTRGELADLLRHCDDRAGRHVVWADRAGEVRVTRVGGNGTPGGVRGELPDVQLYLREFEPGYDYVGPEAGYDRGWVDDLFVALTTAWPKARGRAEVVEVEDW